MIPWYQDPVMILPIAGLLIWLYRLIDCIRARKQRRRLEEALHFALEEKRVH